MGDAHLLFEDSDERINGIMRRYLRLHYVDPNAKCGRLMDARTKRHGYKRVIVCDVEGDWVVWPLVELNIHLIPLSGLQISTINSGIQG